MLTWGCRERLLLLFFLVALSIAPPAEARRLNSGRFRNNANLGFLSSNFNNAFLNAPLGVNFGNLGFGNNFAFGNGFLGNNFNFGNNLAGLGFNGLNNGLFGNFNNLGNLGGFGFGNNLAGLGFGNNFGNFGNGFGNGLLDAGLLGQGTFLRDASGNFVQVATDENGDLLDLFGNRFRLRRDRFGNAFARNGEPIRVVVDNFGQPTLVAIRRDGSLRVLRRRNGNAVHPILINNGFNNNALAFNGFGNGFQNAGLAAAGIDPNSFVGNSLPFGLQVNTPQAPAAQPGAQPAAQPAGQQQASSGAPASGLRLRGANGAGPQTHDVTKGETVQQLLSSPDLVSLRQREQANGNEDTLQTSRRPAVIDGSQL